MIAGTLTHGTGLNLDSIGIIVGAIAAAVGVLIGLQERRNKTITEQITTSVDHLSDVLLAKLETKETVAGLSVRLARIEGQLIGSGHGPGTAGAPSPEV